MKTVLALFWLSFYFVKSAVQSGFDTAKLIVFMPKNLQSGLCTMPYQNINGYPLAILGMMITLTPGTTLIEIDQEKKLMMAKVINTITPSGLKR
ncbi:MAG: Na+/H+ antiporter subunit E [Thiotrichales bacterium]|nr:Na+/H+ antiporter subunit E [Thiotrichales bacterium]